MSEDLPLPRLERPERPRYAAAVTEELLTGGRRLRQAFLETPTRVAARDTMVVRSGEPDAAACLIRSGFLYRSCVLADGRRAILDILIPGDCCGLDHIVLARPIEDITAACRVGYQTLSAARLRELMKDRSVAMHVMALMAEARWRADRLTASIGRLDAQARLGVMLLDIYDRLRRCGLINHASFNLHLTQEQMADHLGLTLVHVNRTLRRLREQRVVIVDRQVVIVMDIDRLRAIAQGLPEAAEWPEPVLQPVDIH